MKKFYEAPVVELTGFSAEDVITTSATTVIKTSGGLENVEAFEAAVAAQYEVSADNVKSFQYGGSYQW